MPQFTYLHMVAELYQDFLYCNLFLSVSPQEMLNYISDIFHKKHPMEIYFKWELFSWT